MPVRPPVDPRWIQNASDRLAVEQGCWFDEDAGQFVCDFIETLCCQSQDEWAGKPIELIPWQRDFLMRLFGWKRPNGRRRFRRAYVEIAKKNGKSTLLSALVIYLLLGDNAGGPKIFINGADREQAKIIFDETAAMVRQSPELESRIDLKVNDHRLVWEEGNGVIIANSGVVDTKDGRNGSAVVFDELHRQPDRRMWNVFRYAGAARSQPLLISLTTAGEEEDGVWHDQRKYSEDVNAGLIPDTTHLGIVYRADPTDDVDDPATWAKANPSLGYTIDPEAFAADLAEAKQVPIDWNEFLRLRLNIVARSSEKFLPDGVWAAGNAPVDEESLRGLACWLGLDLSSVNDLTALIAVFGDPDSGYTILCRFYLPEDNIVALERQHRVPYRHWADQGFITLTPGGSVDYEFIRADVLRWAALYDVQSVFVDPCNATHLIYELRDQDGLDVKEIRQGTMSLNAPTKELLRLAIAGLLRHGGHPVLRWHASNAVVTKDENENIRLNKKKSREKIDGMAGLVNAIAAAMDGGGPRAGRSKYEDEDLLFV